MTTEITQACRAFPTKRREADEQQRREDERKARLEAMWTLVGGVWFLDLCVESAPVYTLQACVSPCLDGSGAESVIDLVGVRHRKAHASAQDAKDFVATYLREQFLRWARLLSGNEA